MPTFKEKLEMAKREGEERIAAQTTRPMEPVVEEAVEVVEEKPKKKPAAKKPAAKKKTTTKKEK